MSRHLELVNTDSHAPARPAAAGGAGVTDLDLMLRVREGEAAAFDMLVRRYERRIVAYLIGIVREREEALDGAQEVFVRVYTRADRYDPASPFKAWIYRIATNVGIDLVRKRRRRRWVGLGDALFSLGSGSRAAAAGGLGAAALSSEPPASTASAESELLQAERNALVRGAIGTLPETYRRAVMLRDLHELSYEEIASVVGCSVGTVKSRVNRARNLLREKLASHAGPPGLPRPSGATR